MDSQFDIYGGYFILDCQGTEVMISRLHDLIVSLFY